MSIQEAASELDRRFRPFQWYQAVGIDSPFDTKLIVYLNFRPGDKMLEPISPAFEGWPVEVKEIGPIAAL